MQIDKMRERLLLFQKQLDQTKAQIGPVNFQWYPYDSLANFQHLDVLLTGEHRALFDHLDERPIVDVGGVDGEVAFYLESLSGASGKWWVE